MELKNNTLTSLAKVRKNVKRKRISSYNKKGTNLDSIIIKPHCKFELCSLHNTGIIKHIWMTLASEDPYYLRTAVLRMWWDMEINPSVEVPVGDFFGVGHAKTVNYWSLPLSMGPQEGKSFNCFFTMPFSENARIEIENESEHILVLYYYIDYEEHKQLDSDFGRFHAIWRRENPCKGKDYSPNQRINLFNKKNPTHENDYVILEAEGQGTYVGCHLDIHNLLTPDKVNKNDRDPYWPGEGDDYIEIDDGESVLYGTGTEDYFCTAWGPLEYFSSPYYGITLPGGKNYSGKISYYRYHIEDPIYFDKNIKVKIEHGHANQRSDDYSSTAYWYQTEPHKTQKLLLVDERLPRNEPKEI
jgi:hypothetical protein